MFLSVYDSGPPVTEDVEDVEELVVEALGLALDRPRPVSEVQHSPVCNEGYNRGNASRQCRLSYCT